MKNELIKLDKYLPVTADKLINFVIVGNEAIQSFKAKLRACNKSEVAYEAKKQALDDGRKISRLVMDAEDKLGELLENTVKQGKTKEYGSIGGTIPSLPPGINKKESHYAQEIYRNPEIVEEVFTTKINDIPSRYDILKRIKKKKVKEKIDAQKKEIKKGLQEPEGLFDHIVIDPPWNYGGEYDPDNRRVSSQYPEMGFDELKELKLPSNDDCILWLWTTHKFIWDAKELINQWGFEYKCILVWDKEKMGIGRWLRLQTEFCLLCIKGKPLWEKKDIRDIIREPRTQHSVKPESFYDMIDNNFIGRKLDYFGRKSRKGWEIYGSGQRSI